MSELTQNNTKKINYHAKDIKQHYCIGFRKPCQHQKSGVNQTHDHNSKKKTVVYKKMHNSINCFFIAHLFLIPLLFALTAAIRYKLLKKSEH